MGEALEKFVAEAQGLYANFESTTLFSIGGWNISQYTLYTVSYTHLTLPTNSRV